MGRHYLRHLFTPSSIAVFGASELPDSVGARVYQNLLSSGFAGPVYPINPKLSKNWRGCNSVAGVKNDERDGWVLAVELAGRHDSLRALQQGDPTVMQLGGLSEKLRELVDERGFARAVRSDQAAQLTLF